MRALKTEHAPARGLRMPSSWRLFQAEKNLSPVMALNPQK